jgi:3-hydroxyisobutyrate dehydrogenase-like beta-hydroxyacid dehydrogenase
MVKDLKYVVDEARRNGSSIPVTQSVLGFYEELVQGGDARKDTSSLIRRLRKD